ncbi:hypothetical protein K4A83_17055 [Spirulina subsalsa FACHB-351]|uniref:Uncharacterized protein n=1 Tax=Spirulina subsalsa FACHB-351 TaxID=234711 RepID=A0ABT3L900_9CYAN|nr:hypothetical protein [Spirulina subsalsa]MCW6037969.1 hypothetical protein [Spirulina subsalsa FACHB-351]
MKQQDVRMASELLMSAGVVSLLLGVIVMGEVLQRLQDVGEVGEEVFRGDRLPVLPFPEPQ